MGRLIDADALKESIVTATLEADRKHLTRRLCYPCGETFAAIDNAPTIEERKTGRWIGKYPVTSACSECNYLIHDSKVKVFAYCPNCGAKMEG